MDWREKLEDIYDRHSASLYAFVLNLLRNEDLTRDVLQEVFRKIANRREILDGVVNERAYLIRLAHNQMIDLLRGKETRNRNHIQFGSENTNPFAQTDDPDESTFRNALAKGLLELPSEQRAVVHLKLWEHLTFDQIAGALEIPMNTAASRYRYGIDKLRTLLRPLYNEIK